MVTNEHVEPLRVKKFHRYVPELFVPVSTNGTKISERGNMPNRTIPKTKTRVEWRKEKPNRLNESGCLCCFSVFFCFQNGRTGGIVDGAPRRVPEIGAARSPTATAR